MSNIRARVAYDPNFLADSIVIFEPGKRVVEWVDGRAQWRQLSDRVDLREPPVDKLVTTDPEILRALYEALAEHFGGTGHDTRALRADYDHERSRVDKMLDSLLATPLTVVMDGKTIMVARGDGTAEVRS